MILCIIRSDLRFTCTRSDGFRVFKSWDSRPPQSKSLTLNFKINFYIIKTIRYKKEDCTTFILKKKIKYYLIKNT